MLENNPIGPVAPRDIFHAHRRRRASIKHLSGVLPLWFPDRTEPLDPFQLAKRSILRSREETLRSPQPCALLAARPQLRPTLRAPAFSGRFRADKPIIHLPPTQIDAVQCGSFHSWL